MGRLDGSEHVLVIPQEALDRLGRFQGFRPCPRDEVGLMLDELLERATFMPRSEILEHGDHGLVFKQVVAYGVLTRRGSVFCFRRPSKGGDSRLRTKSSLGLGGHVNPCDAANGEPADGAWRHPGPDCVVRCMSRELREEVAVDGLSLHVSGLLNDDTNDVGRRHLGVVFACRLGSERVRPTRAEVEPIGWLPIHELEASPVAPIGQSPWEVWSSLIVAQIREVMGLGVVAGSS